MIRLRYLISEDIFKSNMSMKPYEKLMVDSVIGYMNNRYSMSPTIIIKKKSDQGLLGDISLNDNSLNKHKFYLHFNPNQSYNQIIKSLIHELTHVKQVIKKELSPSKDWKSLEWKGKEIISVRDYNKLMKSPSGKSEYMKLPWENEAYNNMNGLYNDFIRSKYWTSLKGQDTNLDYIMDNI